MRLKPRRYPLNQSPLYKLRNRRRLAGLVNLPLEQLEALVQRTDNYWKFSVNRGTPKEREVQTPKPVLERVHRRLFQLLTRIETPAYLHSGVKGRSYVSNAREHLGARELVKVDIVRFFPSTTRLHVFSLFRDQFQCSRDVAGLLAAICTVDRHLPTGSCLSQVLAFWSHKDAFDDIEQLADANDLQMTCYVDDIVLSGQTVARSVLHQARHRIRQQGLLTHSNKAKERRYLASEVKLVTGVVIARNELRLPNRHHKKVHHSMLAFDDTTRTPDERRAALQSSIHRLRSASQIDARFKERARWLRHRLDELK